MKRWQTLAGLEDSLLLQEKGAGRRCVPPLPLAPQAGAVLGAEPVAFWNSLVTFSTTFSASPFFFTWMLCSRAGATGGVGAARGRRRYAAAAAANPGSCRRAALAGDARLGAKRTTGRGSFFQTYLKPATPASAKTAPARRSPRLTISNFEQRKATRIQQLCLMSDESRIGLFRRGQTGFRPLGEEIWAATAAQRTAWNPPAPC